jgi:hypothetical protein
MFIASDATARLVCSFCKMTNTWVLTEQIRNGAWKQNAANSASFVFCAAAQ